MLRMVSKNLAGVRKGKTLAGAVLGGCCEIPSRQALGLEPAEMASQAANEPARRGRWLTQDAKEEEVKLPGQVRSQVQLGNEGDEEKRLVGQGGLKTKECCPLAVGSLAGCQ